MKKLYQKPYLDEEKLINADVMTASGEDNQPTEYDNEHRGANSFFGLI